MRYYLQVAYKIKVLSLRILQVEIKIAAKKYRIKW